MVFLLAFLIAGLLTAVHVSAMAATSHALGAPIRRLQIFYGPSLVLRAARPEIRLGVIPIGGYVQHDDSPDPAAPSPPGPPYRESAGAPPPEAPAIPLIERIGVGRTALILLSGSAALLVLAVLLGGPSMLASAARLPLQLAWLATDQASAVEALRALAQHPLDAAFVGTIAAKLAAANLLPLPGLNGGQLVGLLIPRQLAERGRPVAVVVVPLAMLVLVVLLIVALSRV